MRRSVSLLLFVLLATSFSFDESFAQPRYGSGSGYVPGYHPPGSFGPLPVVTPPPSGQPSQPARATPPAAYASQYVIAAPQFCREFSASASCRCQDPVSVLANAVSNGIARLGSGESYKVESECIINSLASGSFNVDCQARTNSAIVGGTFSEESLQCWCTSGDIHVAVTSSKGQASGNLLKTDVFKPGDSLNAIFKTAQQDITINFSYWENECQGQKLWFGIDGTVGGKMNFAADYQNLFVKGDGDGGGGVSASTFCNSEGSFKISGQASCSRQFWEGSVKGTIGNSPEGSFGGAKVSSSIVFPDPRCSKTTLKFGTWADFMYRSDSMSQGLRLQEGGSAGCSFELRR